jgi:hypothetical protein
MMLRYSTLRLSFGVMVAIALAATLVGITSAAGAQDDISTMLKPLERDGFMFSPSTSPDVASRQPELAKRFADDATRLFGDAPDVSVFAGRLTVRGAHQAGPDSPLLMSDREVVAVRLMGLEQYPLGARNVTAKMKHTELVVFFDAATGEFLVATTSQ